MSCQVHSKLVEDGKRPRVCIVPDNRKTFLIVLKFCRLIDYGLIESLVQKKLYKDISADELLGLEGKLTSCGDAPELKHLECDLRRFKCRKG